MTVRFTNPAKLLAVAALSVGLAVGSRYLAPQAPSGWSCAGSARAMARLELIFGTSRSNGTTVRDEEWNRFMDDEVTPRFPDGLTVLQGAGQWRDGKGRVVKERSIILIIWHQPDRRSEADIEAIRQSYKQRFEQDSVMRIDGTSCVSF